MDTVYGTYREGKIILDEPADWPDDVRVAVVREDEREPIGIPEEEKGDDPESIASRLAAEEEQEDDPESVDSRLATEAEQGDDPESIASWLAAYDALEPFEWTDEERAAWQQAKREQKAYEIATWDERAKKLEKLFE